MCLFFFLMPAGINAKKEESNAAFLFFKCSGWKVGLEPTTFRTTI